MKRNITLNKNKKKTKCDVDYMKTKWKLNKAFDNLLSLNFCVREKKVYLKKFGNLRQKRYKKKFFQLTTTFA